MVTIGSGVFGWLRVKVCIFPYTLKVVLTTLTLPCEVWLNQTQQLTSTHKAFWCHYHVYQKQNGKNIICRSDRSKKSWLQTTKFFKMLLKYLFSYVMKYSKHECYLLTNFIRTLTSNLSKANVTRNNSGPATLAISIQE